MKTKFVILFTVLFCSANAFSQWSSVLNPSTSSTYGISVAVDQDGNIYSAGNTYINTTEKLNIYLVKYSPDGDTLWTRNYDYAQNMDELSKIIVDNDNNVVAAGYTTSASNSEDILVVKFSPSGDVLNTYTFDGTNHSTDMATDIQCDELGNYYVSGKSKLVAYYAYVMIKLNNNLEKQWSKTYSSYYGSVSMSASYNSASQQIAMTGYHTDWDYKYMIGTAVYDTSGTVLWDKIHRLDAEHSSVGFDIYTADGGEVYVCGYDCDTTTNAWEATLMKYSSTGDSLWIHTLNYPSGTSYYNSITADSSGNIYVTGYKDNFIITGAFAPDGTQLWYNEQPGKLSYATRDTYESIKLDPYGNIIVLARDLLSNGGGVQVIKYSSDGTHIWTKHYNGSPSEMDEPVTLAIDANDNIYTVGCSRNSSYYMEMATIEFTPTNTTEISEIESKSSLVFYSNPLNRTISYSGNVNGKTFLRIYSVSGSLAFQTIISEPSGIINIDNLKEGVYLLKTNTSTSKIIITPNL